MNCRHFWHFALVVALAGCAGTPSPAVQDNDVGATLAPFPAEKPARAEDESEDFVDTTRRKVREFAHWLGEEVNDWFGDKPFSDGGKVSHGRLGLRASWREDDGSSTSVRFRARFDLPNLKDKAYVFFGQENERELIADQPETFSREQQLRA